MIRKARPEQMWYVSDMEHVQAAKRYAEIQSRRLGTVNLYQTDDDQEI